MANTQRTPTTGPPFDLSVTGGHPPLRMDINELFKDKIAFSIFVQAMGQSHSPYVLHCRPGLGID